MKILRETKRGKKTLVTAQFPATGEYVTSISDDQLGVSILNTTMDKVKALLFHMKASRSSIQWQ